MSEALSWIDEDEGRRTFEKAFVTARLPEVVEGDLEAGTYTNRHLAEKAGGPVMLVSLLKVAGRLSVDNPANQRTAQAFSFISSSYALKCKE